MIRYLNRGSGTVTFQVPYNPKENTVWSDPVSGRDWRFSGGLWTQVESVVATTGIIAVTSGGTGSSTASGARTNLGLGTLSTQNSDAPFFNGSIQFGAVATTAISLNVTTQTIIIVTGSGVTITLPAATVSRIFMVKNTSAGSITVTSGSLIDGVTNNTVLTTEGVLYVSDGTNWFRFN